MTNLFEAAPLCVCLTSNFVRDFLPLSLSATIDSSKKEAGADNNDKKSCPFASLFQYRLLRF